MRNRSRPVLHIPRTPLETMLEVLTALVIITTFAMTVWGWLILPAIIPTHFGASGTPDAYGGKGGLLILPIISICLAVLLTFLSRFPHIFNFPWPITAENALRQYSLARLLICWITLEMVGTFCGLQWLFIQAAQGHSTGSILLVLPAIMVSALIVTIILYIPTAVRAR